MNSLALAFLINTAYSAPQFGTDIFSDIFSKPAGVVQCNEIKTHVEWRELNSTQQNNYLKAVKCLRSKKSEIPNLNTASAYEDLVATHDRSTRNIHGVPAFLPWHRAFLAIHDNLLRTKCGYKDPMPYWDWTFDSQAPALSTIWKSFGTESKGCVSIPEIGKITTNYPTSHCIERNYGASWLDDQGKALIATQYSPAQMALILDNTVYDDFRRALELGPHNKVHTAIGGDMRSTPTSPNDPIFFLHHRNVDRIWWKWQQQHPDVAFTYKGIVISLIDKMNFEGMYANVRVTDVLNASGGGMDGKLCYKYSNSIVAKAVPNGGKEVPVAKTQQKVRSTGIFNTETPDSNDRTELFNLRTPTPIENEFLVANNVTTDDVKFLRDVEAQVAKFTDFVNSHFINNRASLGELKSSLNQGVRPKTDAEEAADAEKNNKLIALFKEKN